ncbi:pentapeptide repeat-containing protein [Floridanema aerugineum]|uniref:Pentapeptide repeat-containing protein n=1 Tax=Floridaenema aerugineum BLCC-F46 TaxID=3153654 RepID=A0ABV4XDE6_9CYAN
MNDQQLNLVSLFSRIEQLEQHLLIVRKYSTGLKRQLDCVTEQFNNRPELQEWELLKREFAELKKQQNIILGLSDRTFNSQTLDSPPSNETKEDAEIVKEFFQRVDRQLQQDSPTPTVEESQELTSNNEQIISFHHEEIDPVEQETEFSIFTDEEFKIERMLLLLMRNETDEEESLETPVSAEEFLRRCQCGEKDFTGINLADSDFSKKSISWQVNLSKAHLKGGNLSNGSFSCLNLSEANLENADLYKANLQSSKLKSANLKNANLSEADLVNAEMSGANLIETDLWKANLQGAKLTEANLSNANLRKAKLITANLNNTNLSKAILIEADLRSAKLRNANLMGADLTKANLRGTSEYSSQAVDFYGANLKGIKLQQALYDENTRFPEGFNPSEAGAYLIAPSICLQNADLSGADLSGANLTEANLKGANLSKAKLTSANLSGANLTGVNLQAAYMNQINLSCTNLTGLNLIKVDLSNANLSAATLNKTDLREANLTSAKLRGSDLQEADLRAANLSYADLSGANLTGAKLGGANLQYAKLAGAIMPNGTVHE